MLDNRKFQNGVDFYHRLNFVFNLSIAVPLVPFTLLYLGNMKGLVTGLQLNETYALIIDFVTTALLVGISYRTIGQYRSQLSHSRSEKQLRAKLMSYHSALKTYYLSLALAGSCAIMGFFMTQSKIHIITFVLILVVFSLKRPSLKRLVHELSLDEEDASVLRHRQAID